MHLDQEFNTVTKVFYRPIEAAIRWCNLMKYEALILESQWERPELIVKAFPQWPCLHSNSEKILDAIRNQELPYGALGVTVAPGTHVDHRLQPRQPGGPSASRPVAVPGPCRAARTDSARRD